MHNEEAGTVLGPSALRIVPAYSLCIVASSWEWEATFPEQMLSRTMAAAELFPF